MKTSMFVSVLFVSMCFADPCPDCKFNNDKLDRYCLNCGKELRAATQDELNKLEKANVENKKNIEIPPLPAVNNKNSAPDNSDVRFTYRITKYGTSLTVLVTAKNISRKEVNSLSVFIQASCPYWTGNTNATILQSFYGVLLPDHTFSKEIVIEGTGNLTTEDMLRQMKISIEVASIS